MKEPNIPVGRCECPIKKCAHVVDVFRYRGGVDDKKRRFAGRLYCLCDVHGRVENQEFLLENIKWAENENPPADPGAGLPAQAAKPGTAPPTIPAPRPAPKPAPASSASLRPMSDWLPKFYK